MIRRLSWDSDWFGLEVGRFEGPASAWIEDPAFDVVYWLASPDAIAPSGFQRMDQRVEYLWEGQPPALPGDLIEVTGDERQPLIALAESSFDDTRFTRDPRFPRDRVDAMYGEWVRKAEHVYCDELRQGFVTVGSGVLGLIAVSAEARGQGLGGKLIQAAQACGSPLRVVTQGDNDAARRAYERAGFRIETVGTWYHWWRT